MFPNAVTHITPALPDSSSSTGSSEARFETMLVERCMGRELWATKASLLLQETSVFQTLEIWQTECFGRLYRLDGRSMASESDRFLCHEPLVHFAGLAHSGPERILILGGGDGASASECLRYRSLHEVVVVEQDRQVVDRLQRFLPALHDQAFDDPRVRLVIGDAARYVREWQPSAGTFDLVIFDLTDPDTAAAPLFAEPFFAACRRLLGGTGAVVVQLGSLSQREQTDRLLWRLCSIFTMVTPYRFPVPLYGGDWQVAVASDQLDPRKVSPQALRVRLARLAGPPLRVLDANRYDGFLAAPRVI